MRIWLIADDYGISRSVNKAIRELVALRRLSGTSVMTVAPGFDPDEAKLLQEAAGGRRLAIGLHLTLTAPFAPLTPGFKPLRGEQFLSLGDMFRAAFLRKMDRPSLDAEITAQIDAFTIAFGRPPDYVDGHQHVHLLPPVADSLLAIMQERTPHAWVRQCGRRRRRELLDRKALVLDTLSRAFRRRAEKHGIHTNATFAGTYDFTANARFDQRFPRFLDGMTDDGLIMCHPGIVDAMLASLDPLTTLREHEYAYFMSSAFLDALREREISLR